MYSIKFVLCLFLIYKVNCDCDTYLQCFNDFFISLFNDNATDVAVSTENLPDNFDHIENVQVSQLNKVLTQISNVVQSDFTKQLNETNAKVIKNGNTTIFIQDLNHDIDFESLFVNNVRSNEKIDEIANKKLINQETTTPEIIDQSTAINHQKEINESQEKHNQKFDHQQLVVTKIPLTFKINKISYKNFKKDIKENEISQNYDSYYDSIDDNATDYPVIDYIDLYKDTTNEEHVYESTDPTENVRDEIEEKIEDYALEIDDPDNFTSILPCHGNRTGISQTYPWIATIFIKNDTTNNQFEYYCDGALLSDRAIVTAARCVTTENSPVKPENVLVFLGKRSLQTMTENEKIVRINKISIHDNFTITDGVHNDLALLMMEEPVVYNDGIGPACLFYNDEEEKRTPAERSATTAWTVQGDLTPVYFVSKNISCDGQENKICDSYGLDVPLCPSYGGIYVSKQNTGYYLRGIRTGDPDDRGLCFNKDLQYTALDKYRDWITMETLNQ